MFSLDNEMKLLSSHIFQLQTREVLSSKLIALFRSGLEPLEQSRKKKTQLRLKKRKIYKKTAGF